MRRWFAPALVVALFTCAALSALVGVTFLTPSRLIEGLLKADSEVHAIVWEIRLPRIALALVIGAALGVAGALSQGLFANPIAEPSIIGIASGAALGLLTAVALNVVAVGTFGSVVAATLGALIVASIMIKWVPQSPLAFLLTGIALAAVSNSLIGLITSIANRSDLRSISFWSLGSFSLATWSGLRALLPFVVAGLAIAFAISRQLDYLALGVQSARHLGLNINRLRLVVVLALALLVAGSVALTGVIAFVGLVVPHIVRLVLGAQHKPLVIHSALAGALLLVIADTLARVVLRPMELPIGLLTSLLGAPVLLVALRRLRSQT